MLSAGLGAFTKATLATGEERAFMSTLPKSTWATDGEKATLDTVGDVPEGLALIDEARAFLFTIIGEECTGMSGTCQSLVTS